MSDAAQAIFNGFSAVYPDLLPGMCFFHLMKSMRDQKYKDVNERNVFMHNLKSLSKSCSQSHFDASLILFLSKFKGKGYESYSSAIAHLEKVWLTKNNRGWHSGLHPGSVTTNNGLEVTNRVYKKALQGKFNRLLFKICKLVISIHYIF